MADYEYTGNVRRGWVPDFEDLRLEAHVAIIREGSFATLEVTSPGSFFFAADPMALSVRQGDPAVFGALLIVEDGFDSPVMLEITGLPAGVEALIAENPVAPGQTVEVAIPTGSIPKNSTIALGWRGTEVV